MISKKMLLNKRKNCIKTSLYIGCLLFSFPSTSQFIEYGGSIGMITYAGDLQRGFNLLNPKLGFAARVGFNFTEYSTARISIMRGRAKGSEVPIDELAVARKYEFISDINEISATYEYNFLDYKTHKSQFKFSPYLYGGIGFLYFTDARSDLGERKLQLTLPFGIGIKCLVSKIFSLGIEAGARKTFFDYLDGISGGVQTIKDFQYGNPYDTDWYHYIGINFNVIIHKIPCPFPYIPNEVLIRSRSTK